MELTPSVMQLVKDGHILKNRGIITMVEESNNVLSFNNLSNELSMDELYDCSGGLAITIMGVTFVGWKAAAIIAAGVTTLAGAAGLGFWNGYNNP